MRVESGTINRGIYRWAVLADGGETGRGWNGRLRYEFGGGCGTGHHQGTLGPTAVLDNDVLSEGYANATATLNTFGVNCNDVLSAETMSMVKERLIEELRRPPSGRWAGAAGRRHPAADDRPELPRPARRDRPQRDLPGQRPRGRPPTAVC